MKERQISIRIIDGRRHMRWLGTVLSISLTTVLPILLGVQLQSTAMQWIGFVFALLTVIAITHRESNRNTFDNIDAAKRRLDELKEGNSW